MRLQVGVGGRFLFTRTSSLGVLADLKFQFFPFRNVGGIVIEAIHEFALNLRLRSVLLALLSELLELKSLQIDLLEALHARIVLHGTLECALRNIGKARQRLHLEVTAIDKLIDVFFVHLFELFFERSVVLRHLQLRSLNLGLVSFLRSLFLRCRPLVAHVVEDGGLISLVHLRLILL